LCKGEDVPVHAIKACSGSRGIAELVHNLGISWKRAVSFTARLLYFGDKKLLHLLNRRLGGILRASLHIAEKTNSVPPARNIIPDPLAHTAI
jgi:hypothetical protein